MTTDAKNGLSVAELMALVDAYADTAAVNGIRSQWAQMARGKVELAFKQFPAPQAQAGFVTAEAYDRLQALCDSQAAHILAAEYTEPVHWLAVLDPEQVPHQLKTSMHAVGFRNPRSAESWIAERLDFDGWRYTLEPLYAARQPQADARDAEITWPMARDVGRIGDMSQCAHMRVGLDSDNDVYVSVGDENGGGSIEFCNPGGGGGGQSSRTRMALIALMVAMEADNTEKPSRDWWAQRSAIAAAKGE